MSLAAGRYLDRTGKMVNKKGAGVLPGTPVDPIEVSGPASVITMITSSAPEGGASSFRGKLLSVEITHNNCHNHSSHEIDQKIVKELCHGRYLLSVEIGKAERKLTHGDFLSTNYLKIN